jgi:hypothetical protein
MPRPSHILLITLITLGTSSLILKSATLLHPTPLVSTTDKKLIDFMSNNGFNYVNSWLIISGTAYRATKFRSTIHNANCANDILVIGMSGDATLVAMLESSVNRNKETLLYLYNGTLHKHYPKYRIWWGDYQRKIKKLFDKPAVTQSVLGLFSAVDCTPINNLPWREYHSKANQ